VDAPRVDHASGIEMFSLAKLTGRLRSLVPSGGARDFVGGIVARRFNQTSAARTKLILDVAGDGIFGLDVDGKITFANHAAARMLAAKRGDIVGRPMRQVVDHLKADGSPFPGGASPIVGAASEGTSCVSSDEIFRRNDGASLVVDYVSNPIFERGKLTGAVVAFTDVTQRKRSEEALQSRYKELAILHEIGQMIFASRDLKAVLGNILERALALVSLDLGNIRLFEPGGRMQTGAYRGYRDPEQIGKHINMNGGDSAGFTRGVVASGTSLVLEDIATVEGLRTFKHEGVRSAIIVPITTAEETLGIIEVGSRTSRRFLPDELRLLDTIGNQIGIAVQKSLLFEETARRAEEQAALNTIAAAVSRSLRLNETLEIALDKVLEVTGREQAYIRLMDPVSGNLTLAAHRGISPQFVETLTHHRTPGGKSDLVFESGEPLVINDPATSSLKDETRREGSRAFVWVPLKVRGRAVGIMNVATVRPLPFQPREVELLKAIGNVIGVALENSILFQETERRNREIKIAKEKLEKVNSALTVQAAELARSNSELQHFAYIASHDLQEPLRMVASYMQLLARRYQDKLDQDANEFIAFAVDGATRMQALINALLTYSRVGTQTKKFEPTDCEAVLDDTLAGLKAAVEESGAVITRDSLPTVIGDATQLGQLFQNLIGNGIKFRGAEPPRVHISSRRDGQWWVFSVRDHGIGFDSRYAERIFVMFQRLHAKEEYPGTGIGLAVCKKIVERHGGEIWVESRPGEGATFYFTIPTNGHEKENTEHAFGEHERIG
jgi:PAS domain S-box-containing protein